MSEPPRWLADEMLGRLARYLRFLGFDTAYVRGASDDEVAERARREARILITRDAELASRFRPSQLLRSGEVARQLSELRFAFPDADWHVRFDRCTLCNGHLRPWVAGSEAWPTDVPRSRVESGLPVFECEECRHRYWEGSHTARVRRDVNEWLSGEVPP